MSSAKMVENRMPHDSAIYPLLGLFNLGGGEIILLIALPLILLYAERLPDIARGLGTGVSEFWKATRNTDEEAEDAGRSLGGIYGKPAAQVLTPDNQIAELYDPEALREKPLKGSPGLRPWFRRAWKWLYS